jgi:hypothetical protein
MMQKRLLVPSRMRRIPEQFSWIDQRLVRDHHIERADCTALGLYLFLLTVADAQGLSYYANASIARILSLRPEQVVAARKGLMRAGLIAYEAPLYQVLALDPTSPAAPMAQDRAPRSQAQASEALRSIREVLRQTLEAQS